MERYEIVKDIGSGNFAVAKLVKDKSTNEYFAVKFIERGHKVCFFSSFPLQFLFRFSYLHFKAIMILVYGWVWNCFIFGAQIDENVQREIMNHRSLKHPNIVRFKEVSELKSSIDEGTPLNLRYFLILFLYSNRW